MHLPSPSQSQREAITLANSASFAPAIAFSTALHIPSESSFIPQHP
jgi:hypothetical protein